MKKKLLVLIITIILILPIHTKDKYDKKKFEDYNTASKYLAVRLWPKHKLFMDNNIDKIVFYEHIKETVSVLVFDINNSAVLVSPSFLEKWNKKEKELFEKALENMAVKYTPEIINLELSNNIKCMVIENLDLYNTSFALLIDKNKKWHGKHGTIIGIPNKTALIIFPVNKKDVINFINIIIPAIDGMYKEGPGETSPYLYWYYKGKYIKITYSIIGEKYSVNIPQKLKELVE